jgi:hypothetical protein
MATPQRMTLLQRRLRHTAAGADVRLLAEDQVVVSRNLTRDPNFERDGKSPTYRPGRDGYQVYVSWRPAAAHARQAALSQRMTGPSSGPVAWDGRTMRLRLDPATTSGEWLVGDNAGGIVTVIADAGSVQVLDEVNAVLNEVEAVLLT